MEIKYLGEMIRYHRKKSGLSQEQLAIMSGLGKTVIFDLEKGKLTIRLATLLKVLNVLNIHIDFDSPLMKKFGDALNEKS